MFFYALKMVCTVLFSGFELLYSVIRFGFLKRDMITFFGGAKNGASKLYGKESYQVAYRMVEGGYGVIAGGGSGIMKEAHHGACAAKHDLGIKETLNVGVAVNFLKEGRSDAYADYFLSVRTFFVRKWLLMRFSLGFIIFPGGFGTMDEFMELITLLKTGAMGEKKIVLFCRDYWTGFLQWMDEQSIQRGMDCKSSLDLFEVVDTVDEAVRALKKCCEGVKK